MGGVVKFPGVRCRSKTRDNSAEDFGGGSFFALRCASILSRMENRVKTVEGENFLKLDSFITAMEEIAKIFPEESIRIGDIITFGVINKENAERATNVWAENKLGIRTARESGFGIPPSTLSELRNIRTSFANILDEILNLPIVDIRSYLKCIAGLDSDDETVIKQTLELCTVDFDVFLRSFYNYLKNSEFLIEHSEKLETLRNTVARRVETCLVEEEGAK